MDVTDGERRMASRRRTQDRSQCRCTEHLTGWGVASAEDGQRLWLDQQLDASGDAGFPFDEAEAFERDDHLVDRWGRNAEVALHVGFGRWALVDAAVGIDEGQVLTLCRGEARAWGLCSRV